MNEIDKRLVVFGCLTCSDSDKSRAGRTAGTFVARIARDKEM